MGQLVSIYDGESGTGRENRLHYWLRFDYWTFVDAMFILCDLDPDLTAFDKNAEELTKAGNFAGQVLDPWESAIDEAAMRVRDLRRIYWSGQHDEEMQSPASWIAWARRKRLRIPWLEWAERSHLLPNDPANPSGESQRSAQPEASAAFAPVSATAVQSDPDHPNWPEELGIALTAWRAAINRKDAIQRPASFIRDWLRTHYPKLSDAARDRIATVANWDKSPGASKGSDAEP
jgi:hypothetical protein